MNIRQRKRIENITRILSKQDECVIFKIVKDAGYLYLWADNANGRWFATDRVFHAVIGVKGGVKILSKRNFVI